jgi:hypothetical protein
MLNMFLMPKYKMSILLLDIISFNKHRLTYVPTVHGGQNKISFLTLCSRTMKKDSPACTIPTINHSHEVINSHRTPQLNSLQVYLRLGGVQDGQGELLLHEDLAGALVGLLKSCRLHIGSRASLIGLRPFAV